MPPSPTGLKFNEASDAYLQTVTAYFFPTVTTQIANVLCKRSWKSPLFSVNFLNPMHRREALEAISNWRPPRYTTRVRIDYHIKGATELAGVHAFTALAGSLPVRDDSLLLRISFLVEYRKRMISIEEKEPFTIAFKDFKVEDWGDGVRKIADIESRPGGLERAL